MVSGDKNGVILMWDIDTEKGASKDVAPSARFDGHRETVLPFTPRARNLLSLSRRARNLLIAKGS